MTDHSPDLGERYRLLVMLESEGLEVTIQSGYARQADVRGAFKVAKAMVGAGKLRLATAEDLSLGRTIGSVKALA